MAWPAGPGLAAALLTVGLYAVTIGGTYIYDDVSILQQDGRLQSPAKWGEIWTQGYNGGVDNLYRPLTTQSFAMEWWLHGDRAWAFHLVNVLLGAGAAAAVAEFARRLAGMKAGYVAGLLFAAHPVHVEAVAEIVGRSDELATLFIFCALAMFLRRPLTSGRSAAIGVCAIAAMLSKETGLLSPFLLAAMGTTMGWRAESEKEKSAVRILILILSWSLAGVLVLREEFLNLRFEWAKNFVDYSIQPLIRSGPVDRVLMGFVLLGRYAQLMIAPVKLSIDYGLAVMRPVADRGDPYLYLGVLTALAWAGALGWSLMRRRRAAVFCLIAAGMTYLMVSNVILIGTIFGERLVYLPSAFLLIWASIYLVRLPAVELAGLVAMLVVLGGLRTVTYARRWNDREQFYATSLAEQPRSVKLYVLLGAQLMDRGELAEAAQVAAEGTQVAPDYWNIWYLAGEIAERQGDLVMADSYYKRAFKMQLLPQLQIKIQMLDARIRSGR